MRDLLEAGGSHEKMAAYFMKIKEETGKRLMNILYHPEHGDMDCKHWVMFGKKPFLGRKFNSSI